MPKPGRPPKDTANKRDTRLSVRISAKLRGMLEDARREPEGERSLSDEVSLRLWESFTADEKIAQRFGGPETAALLQIIAGQIGAVQIGTGGENWLADRFTFDQVKTMITVLLDGLKPSGKPGVMPAALRRWHPSMRSNAKTAGKRAAMRALEMLEAATHEEVPSELPPRLYFRAAQLLKKSSTQTKGGRK
jgi:hypothetical protein